MKKIDYEFICENMSQLSGFPIRHYIDNHCISTHTLFPLTLDPVKLCESDLLSIEQQIGYYITPYHFYFGIVRREQHALLIGPIAYVTPDKTTIRKMAFLLGSTSNADTESFRASMTYTPVMSPNNFLHMLIMLHYYVNDEMVSMQDIMLYDSLSPISFQSACIDFNEKIHDIHTKHESYPAVHNTMQFEDRLLSYVASGDSAGITDYVSNFSPGNIGKTASSHIRQLKNTFIITITLVSRAAIHGGLSAEEALSLSDTYIQKVETLDNSAHIMNLHLNMVLDYTDRVQKLKSSGMQSKFIRSINDYLEEHLTDGIRIQDIADHMQMTRNHLTTRFKAETGLTLSEYITQKKIEEAKQLLKSSDRSLVEISNYLGFSSQSHFQNTFKRITQMTPRQYRESL